MQTNTNMVASYQLPVASKNGRRSLHWQLSAAPAFTLIELMISIALALLLILAVNQVFQYTTQAVGAGEAVNSGIRNSRAGQATFAGDFADIVPNGGGPNDSAFLYIASYANYAFRNAKDQASEGTTSGSLPIPAYLDLAGTGNFGDPTVPGDIVYPSTYNFRNHRLDLLSFFARGLFFRQTGNDGTFVDNMASQEAWIWYGHLRLPDNSASNYFMPAAGTSATNPNNSFGSQFVLGRVAMLLRSGTPINDNQGNAQKYIDYSSGAWASILYGSQSIDSFAIQNSRYDLANGSISQFDSNLQAFIKTNGANSWTGQINYRFLANPFVSKPMKSLSMAQASPYFLGGCSQFMVEYAGDFLKQDSDPSHTPYNNPGTRTNFGDVNAYAPDGQIDFTVTYPPNGTPNPPPVKQIKWYGMPRSTSGNVTLNGANGDVVPLRDWLQGMKNSDGTAATPASLTSAPFEKAYPPLSEIGNYAGANGLQVADTNNGYVCAFGPNDPAPKLIRITITLDDPTGRLPDGQTYQYVFAVPQQ